MTLLEVIVPGPRIGGLSARQWHVVAPFWFAFVGTGFTLIVLWPQLGRVVPDRRVEDG